MVTLRDILPLVWDVVELDLCVRKESFGRLVSKYKIGPGCNEDSCTYAEWDDVKKGKLMLIDIKINEHGSKKKNGLPEMGWGVNLSRIPDNLLDMEVDKMDLSRYREGEVLTADLSVPVGGQMALGEAVTW